MRFERLAAAVFHQNAPPASTAATIINAPAITNRAARFCAGPACWPGSSCPSRSAAPRIETIPATNSTINPASSAPRLFCIGIVLRAAAGAGTAIVPEPASPSASTGTWQEPGGISQGLPGKNGGLSLEGSSTSGGGGYFEPSPTI